MRHWLLVSVFLLVCSAIVYYVFYGRLHNKIEPRLNIRYQESPTKQPLQVVGDSVPVPTLGTNTGGSCNDLPERQDVHAMYVKSLAKDCGALNDNEMVMDEAQTKDIFHCMQNDLDRKGVCGNSKAFLTLQGFEGIIEVFVESKNCKVSVKQWSTTSPQCGYSEEVCDAFSDRFPFQICST